jgi:hypothetical protein
MLAITGAQVRCLVAHLGEVSGALIGSEPAEWPHDLTLLQCQVCLEQAGKSHPDAPYLGYGTFHRDHMEQFVTNGQNRSMLLVNRERFRGKTVVHRWPIPLPADVRN